AAQPVDQPLGYLQPALLPELSAGPIVPTSGWEGERGRGSPVRDVGARAPPIKRWSSPLRIQQTAGGGAGGAGPEVGARHSARCNVVGKPRGGTLGERLGLIAIGRVARNRQIAPQGFCRRRGRTTHLARE